MLKFSDPAKDGVVVPTIGGRAPAAVLLESPSLFGGAGDDDATAYEVKFVLTEGQAAEVAARVNGKLFLDPFADPAMGHAYLTTSVYTDTPAFDVFRRTEGYDRDKFRVRRYGADGPVFVERKAKNGEKVRKHRERIDVTAVADFSAPVCSGERAGGWFHRQLREKLLKPVCRITYERVAFLGTADGTTARLTFDRNIRGALTTDWVPNAVETAAPLLANRVVCEFKFRTAMPALFRGIVADLKLAPASFSKYRVFVKSAGLSGGLPTAEAEGSRADG
ncbi:polyphosphate polymerase domain-containing protein [Fimbriiglobus ruber]|uniref:VTC domain-containing protein n=1 Tax=Fimbriiglobus ruber TaxID=1908690 RepID=A0A225DCV8_9BACT|nr:polyphosphate polymerase domain-containing protein [Fimbriiglobus ruber]OWK37464.1 hypothetical protein FRUB_06584 [Fimbriiglobus ruber]